MGGNQQWYKRPEALDFEPARLQMTNRWMRRAVKIMSRIWLIIIIVITPAVVLYSTGMNVLCCNCHGAIGCACHVAACHQDPITRHWNESPDEGCVAERAAGDRRQCSSWVPSVPAPGRWRIANAIPVDAVVGGPPAWLRAIPRALPRSSSKSARDLYLRACAFLS